MSLPVMEILLVASAACQTFKIQGVGLFSKPGNLLGRNISGGGERKTESETGGVFCGAF